MIRFHFHPSPNPMKVALMLEETGLAYELAPVDTRKGEQHAPAFLAVNPNGKTPAIEDGGAAVFDSNAILLYLSEKTGQFGGAPEARSEVLSWLMFIATGVGPYCGQHFHFKYIAPQGNEYAANRYKLEAERHFRVLDRRLSSTAYLAGADYTVADIAAWGWLRLADGLFGEGALANYPSLARWFEAVDGRPAAERARRVGADVPFKAEMDETALRALFPQNYPPVAA